MTQDNETLVPVGLQDMITTERPTGADEGELGNEGITQEDLTIPRLALAQKTSREIDPTDAARFIPGLQFTDLFNSMSKKPYGKGPLLFSILHRYDPRWMEFIPLTEGGGIRDRNVPAGDPRTEFGPDGKKPIATMFYDYLIIIWNDLDPTDPLQNIVMLSCKDSALKAAKHLNMLIQQRGKKLICKGVYEVRTGSDVDKKSGGVYAIYKFKNAGWLKPDSPFEKIAIEMFESWKDRDVTIDEDTDFNPEALEHESREGATVDAGM